MGLTPSTMLELGTPAPAFCLPDTNGNEICLDDFRESPVLLVVFMCNHCPYVKHIASTFRDFVQEYQAKGLAVVGISSNDAIHYPDDGPERMKEEAIRRGYTFPYLYDESQETAKDFHAACTPDFFLFDRERKLAYRGQFDGSRPGNDVPVTGNDLRQAVDALLAGTQPRASQAPSIGCNIKWRPGNEPGYFG